MARARVRIAPLSAADEADYIAAAKASRRLHAQWVQVATTPEAYRDRLQRLSTATAQAFAVRRLDSGALVGCVEVTGITRGLLQSAYCGYYAFAGHERQGLMTEGLRQVARHAFGPMKLHRLEANMQPGNAASIALARAAGFSREGFSPRYLKIRGRWRDHERWALLSDG